MDKPSIPIEKIEIVSIGELKPSEYNPRRSTVEEARQIKESIMSLGFIDPIILNRHAGRENVIIGGHQRYYAARELGFETVPCVYVDYDAEKEKEANLRLNKNVAGWDWEALASFDPTFLREVGFSELELVEHFDLDEREVEEDDFNADNLLDEEANIHVGDVFALGDHRLMCGDATDPEHVAKLMNGEKASMVFTDPPYNVDYKGGMNSHGQNEREGIMNDKMDDAKFYDFLYTSIKNMMDVTEGAFYIFMSSQELPNLKRAFEEAGGHYQSIIIWAKNTFTLSRSDYQHQFEPALYGWRDGVVNHYFIGTRKESDIWEDIRPSSIEHEDGKTIVKLGEKWLLIDGEVKVKICDKEGQTDLWREDKPSKSKDHPTMKPLRLVARAVRNSSLPGEIVLDLFGGSGSTLVTCETMARKCYTMELDPKYVNVIIKRWESHTGRKADKLENGEKKSFWAKIS